MSAESFRVAVHSDDYFPNIGGVATHVHELTAALVNLDVRAAVITGKPPIADKPSLKFRSEPGPPPVLRLSKQPPIFARYYAAACRKAIQEALAAANDEPLIFHSHYHQPWWVDSSWPQVFTNHTSMFLQEVGLGRTEYWRKRLSVFDAFIAPSTELAQGMVDLGVAEDRVTYIPNGVDAEKFQPNAEARAAVRQRLEIAEDAIVLLSARRIVPKNGVIDLVHALRYLEPQVDASKLAKVVLVIAGNEPKPICSYQPETLESLRRTDLGRKALVLGEVPNHDMPELFAAADISVLPSLKEATSIAGLEAMASGVPLVGTKVGGVPDLITDEEDGLLVDHGNSVELAAALAKMINNDQLRQTMSRRVREKAATQFSWETIAKRTMDVYRQARELAAERNQNQ